MAPARRGVEVFHGVHRVVGGRHASRPRQRSQDGIASRLQQADFYAGPTCAIDYRCEPEQYSVAMINTRRIRWCAESQLACFRPPAKRPLRRIDALDSATYASFPPSKKCGPGNYRCGPARSLPEATSTHPKPCATAAAAERGTEPAARLALRTHVRRARRVLGIWR